MIVTGANLIKSISADKIEAGAIVATKINGQLSPGAISQLLSGVNKFDKCKNCGAQEYIREGPNAFRCPFCNTLYSL